jgi:hypothetical protein
MMGVPSPTGAMALSLGQTATNTSGALRCHKNKNKAPKGLSGVHFNSNDLCLGLLYCAAAAAVSALICTHPLGPSPEICWSGGLRRVHEY